MKKTAVGVACACFIVSLLAWDERVRCVSGGLLLLIAAMRDRRSLTALGSYTFWVFPLLFIVLSPLFLGENRIAIGGVPYSIDQLKKGGAFLFHAYCFVVFGAYLSRAFSLQEIVRAAERAGAGNMGLRVALGAAAGKILRLMVLETYGTYRMTRPTLLSAVRECHILLGAIARNAALVAERITILFYIRNIRVGTPPASGGPVVAPGETRGGVR